MELNFSWYRNQKFKMNKGEFHHDLEFLELLDRPDLLSFLEDLEFLESLEFPEFWEFPESESVSMEFIWSFLILTYL